MASTGYGSVNQSWSMAIDWNPNDVDLSKSINITDVQLTANIVIGITAIGYQGQGNVDGDSKTNVIDVQKIINKILNP